jgi:excisionase family DNA binding protein
VDRLLIPQQEACERLGVSRLTLIREIEAGRLCYVLVGKRQWFSPQELAYCERQVRGCDGSQLWSLKARRTAIATARSTAIDFESALALTTGKPPKSGRR